jgi:peroxiredoxin Q/BCP
MGCGIEWNDDQTESDMTIKIGNKAPKLSGTTQSGDTLKLADLRGQWVVLYFYPKDNTTGCTREAGDFRDLYTKFKRRGAAIVGVSRDSARSHHGFKEKLGLPFMLVADTEEVWCKAFDVIRKKKLYGREYLGVDRSTFLIDPEGRLVREWRGVKVPGHAEAVLDAIPAK